MIFAPRKDSHYYQSLGGCRGLSRACHNVGLPLSSGAHTTQQLIHPSAWGHLGPARKGLLMLLQVAGLSGKMDGFESARFRGKGSYFHTVLKEFK